MQAMSLNEAAQDLLSVMNRVNDDHEPLVVTDGHHKFMVIISLDDFNAWRESARITSSGVKNLPEAVEEISIGAVRRRKPSAKIAGKGHILGDLVTPVVAAEDWSALA